MYAVHKVYGCLSAKSCAALTEYGTAWVLYYSLTLLSHVGLKNNVIDSNYTPTFQTLIIEPNKILEFYETFIIFFKQTFHICLV